MKYHMIFSDMDGTLLKGTSELTDGNRKSICHAVDAGVDFVICTGRGIYGVENFLQQLALIGKKGFVICQNGAAVYDLQTMEMVQKHTFSAEELEPVVTAARRLGIAVYLYDDRTFLAEKDTEEVRHYCAVMHTDMRILEDGLAYEGRFTKCLLSGTHDKLVQLRAETADAVQGKLDSFYSSATYLEFVKVGINKGRALLETAEIAGISPSNVIAIGDSDNDIPMLRVAGLGIAVANAQEDVKQYADFVTTADCAHDAIAEVIETFIFPKEDGK